MNDEVLRLGTRGSALARWQADWVAARLSSAGFALETVVITTQGDATSQPLTEGGGVGLFTKEIQRAVLDHRVDLAVHSLKDLPTEPVTGLTLAAVPPRECHRDALVAREAADLASLPPAARMGTGSRRRASQLLHLRPDLRVEPIRGNVDTRLGKLAAGQFDALILAEAGLRRLGLADRITQVIPEMSMLPAIGQGALGIECRAEDERVIAALATLEDPHTRASVVAERSLLAALRAGCLAPVGAWARVDGEHLVLDAVVLSADGTQRIHDGGTGSVGEAEALGVQVAQRLLEQGAAELIHEARDE